MYFNELKINRPPTDFLWTITKPLLHSLGVLHCQTALQDCSLVSQECFQKLLLHLKAPEAQEISRTGDSMQQPHCVVILKYKTVPLMELSPELGQHRSLRATPIGVPRWPLVVSWGQNRLKVTSKCLQQLLVKFPRGLGGGVPTPITFLNSRFHYLLFLVVLGPHRWHRLFSSFSNPGSLPCCSMQPSHSSSFSLWSMGSRAWGLQ